MPFQDFKTNQIRDRTAVQETEAGKRKVEWKKEFWRRKKTEGEDNGNGIREIPKLGMEKKLCWESRKRGRG